MLDSFTFWEHLCISFELLNINLYEFLKVNKFRGFKTTLVKRFAVQLLISLLHMWKHNVVHCDIKPENILLKKPNKSGIKLVDFGSGCLRNQQVYTYI